MWESFRVPGWLRQFCIRWFPGLLATLAARFGNRRKKIAGLRACFPGVFGLESRQAAGNLLSLGSALAAVPLVTPPLSGLESVPELRGDTRQMEVLARNLDPVGGGPTREVFIAPAAAAVQAGSETATNVQGGDWTKSGSPVDPFQEANDLFLSPFGPAANSPAAPVGPTPGLNSQETGTGSAGSGPEMSGAGAAAGGTGGSGGQTNPQGSDSGPVPQTASPAAGPSAPILPASTSVSMPAGPAALSVASAAPTGSGTPPGAVPSDTSPGAPPPSAPQAALANLPLRFEANHGQADSRAQFLARGQGYGLFLNSSGALLSLPNPASTHTNTAVQMTLVGSNPNAQAIGLDQLATKTNYFSGRDPSKWHTDIPNFSRVEYQNVYPGINLVYYGTNQRQLEYDFVVQPGALPGAIHLSYTGTSNIHLDAQGNLVLQSAAGALTEKAPVIYQDSASGRQTVGGHFVITGGQVSFQVGAYDASKPLIIDPVLSYSTYLGGTFDDQGLGIAVDGSGSAYAFGISASEEGWPTTTVSDDPFFVAKFNPTGSALVYLTFVSGNSPTSFGGIAVDSSGNAYFTGWTDNLDAVNFPATVGAWGGGDDAVVAKLDAAGNLAYATFLGGSGDDHAYGIAVDASGSAFVAGSTASTDFPTRSPYQSSNGGGTDAFVAKLTADGSSLAFSTYLGGMGNDVARAVALNSSGNAYVAGYTWSSNFPTSPSPYQATKGGGKDAFLAKLSTSGSALSFSTYYGGSGDDQANGLALDSANNIYLVGSTTSTDLPTYLPYQPSKDLGTDAFLAKFNSTASSLVYATYLGGSGTDIASGVAVDASHRAFVVGQTTSTDFPMANATQGANVGNTTDGFITEVAVSGTWLVYSSYLGGSGADQANAVAVDGSHNIYITGTTASQDFLPVNALQPGNAGGTDAFVTKVSPSPINWAGSPAFSWTQTPTPPPSVTNPGNKTNAENATVSLQVQATDPNNYPLTYAAVNLPGGLSISSAGLISGTVDYAAAEYFAGVYNVTVIVANNHGGSATVSFTWTVSDTPRAPVVTNPGSQSTAQGGTASLQITASDPDGGQLQYYQTGLPAGLDIDNLSGQITGTVSATAAPGSYSVTVTADDLTLTASQTFTWTVSAASLPPALTAPGDQTNAAGDVVALALSASDPYGRTLTYTASGLPSGLAIDPSSGQIAGTIANAAASSTPYNVTVKASDGVATASQTFHWTINYVGVTNPGTQNNTNGNVVSLAITAATAGGTLSYSATHLPAGLGINISSGVISGTILSTADASSPYATTVTATDGTHPATVSFTWNVAHLSLVPPPSRSDREGTAISLQLSATDSDTDVPTYSASGLPAGLNITTGGLISGNIGLAAHGQSPYQVTVQASDGSHTASQSFVWTVTPRVALVNPGPQYSAAGNTVSLQVQATAVVSGTLGYSATGLPSGLGINSAGLISGTIVSGAASSTPYAVTVTAGDGTSTSIQTFFWTVSVINVVAPGVQTNLDGDTVSLPISAQYHGAGTLAYSATRLPAGLGISASTGLISGTIAATADAGGPYSTTVTVTDNTSTSTQTFTWSVNQRITVTAPTDQASGVGDFVSLAIAATDSPGGTLSYAASGLPGGLHIDSTGLISGTIALGAETSSPYNVTVTVSDAALSTTTNFHWTVKHVSLLNPGNQLSADGATGSLALVGRDFDGGAVTFGATGLPAGLGINVSTGVISGPISNTADTNSPYNVTVTASDGPNTTYQTFQWQVLLIGVVNPGNRTSVEGDTVSLPVTATIPTGTLTYSAGSLPPGLSINTTSGVISGTIAAGAPAHGPYTTTVAATNGTLAYSQTFTWTVNPRVSLTQPADQTNVEGNAVSLQIQASESGATLIYNASNLPLGLGINSTGLITGTVATGDSAASPQGVTVTVSDGTYSSSTSFVWTITHGNNAVPVLTNPSTQVNVAADNVYLPLTASDTDNDFLTFSATGLPHGLQINPYVGVIFGTLASDSAQTLSAVTVTVDDGNGGTASQTFNWIINDAKLAAQGTAFSATEGTEVYNLTVANFTDTNKVRLRTEYTATINWGDGNTDQGFVTGSAGSFTVAGQHLYEHPGSFPVGVTVIDPVGSTVGASTTATVAAAPLTATGGLTSFAVKGNSATQTLATFSDGNADDVASSYAATINWGDSSSPTAGTVAGSAGEFTVSGAHSYSFVGSYTVTVTILDQDGTQSSTTSSVVAGDLFAGIQSNLTVATFTSADASAVAANFTATVNWGDGSALGTGTVSGANGLFSVTATHSYSTDNSYTVQVTITDSQSNSIIASNNTTVVPVPITLYANNQAAVVGVAVTNPPIAFLVDPNTADSASKFNAFNDWNDGSAGSTSTITGSSVLFTVNASHTFATAAWFKVQTRIDYSATTQVYKEGVGFSTAIAAPQGGGNVPQLYGPSVVPLGGRYQYSYYLPVVYQPKNATWEWVVNAMGDKQKPIPAQLLPGLQNNWWASALVTFDNAKADWTILTLQATFKGQKTPTPIASIEVGTVAISVTNTGTLSPGRPSVATKAGPWQRKDNTPFDLSFDNWDTKDYIKQTRMSLGNEPLYLISTSSKGGLPGFVLTTDVKATAGQTSAKKDIDISQIQVGIIQVVNSFTGYAEYGKTGYRILRSLMNNNVDWFSYSGRDVWPWYSPTLGQYVPTLAKPSTFLAINDSPGGAFPLQFDPVGQFQDKTALTAGNSITSFTDYIAERTTQQDAAGKFFPGDTDFFGSQQLQWSVVYNYPAQTRRAIVQVPSNNFVPTANKVGASYLIPALSEISLSYATSRTTRRHRLWIFRGTAPSTAAA